MSPADIRAGRTYGNSLLCYLTGLVLGSTIGWFISGRDFASGMMAGSGLALVIATWAPTVERAFARWAVREVPDE